MVTGSIGSASMNAQNAIIQKTRVVATTQSDDTIRVTLAIGSYQIQNSENGAVISIEDFGQLLIPGKPSLPSKIFAVAVPPGATIVNVKVEAGDGVTIPGTFHVAPSPLPRVTGDENPVIAQAEQQRYDDNYRSVYKNNDPYPQQIGEYVRTASYRKYTMADVQITPFTYHPILGQLIYYPEVTIIVQYSNPENGFSAMSDNQLSTERTAHDILINYDQATTWYTSTAPSNRGLHDYVIITLPALTTAVSPLVDWETSKGRTVAVVTTTGISANYTGYDLAEKIRNFLRDKYPTGAWGIEDVLLVGGYNDVPMRTVWQDVGYGRPKTDFYYAELSLPDTQSWDINGNHRWGENSDPIDFYAEVNVGRIPWNDATTVQHICEKSVAYEQNSDPAFKENILLLGGFFWDNDPNPRTDNAVLMEYKTNPSHNSWMANWTKTRMYEQGYSTYSMDYDLTYSNVENIWSAGTYAFVNWAGHGSPTECVRYHPTETDFVNTDTCTSLNDAYPSIIFANACSNSDPSEVNLGQSMLKRGAVGFVGATNVALGCPGWTNPNSGSSQSLDYYFTSDVTSGEYSQGAALQRSLRQMYTNNLWDSVRYEMFEWGALYGNPDVTLSCAGSNIPPVQPSQPTGPMGGIILENYTFCVNTPDDPDGTVIFLRWDWGDGTFSDWSGPYGEGVQVCADHSWNNPGNYSVRVQAKDINGSFSSWSVPLIITITAPPNVEIVQIKGGFGVSAIIRNNGDSELTNVSWIVSLDGGFVMGTRSINGQVSSIPSGQEITIKTGLIFGLGHIAINITAGDATKTATGFLIGLVILNVH